MSLRGPPQAGRGNLNRHILDCFVVKLLAMTAKTQLIPRERLQKLKLFGGMPYLHCGHLFFVSILDLRYDDLYWLFPIAICTNGFAGSTDSLRPKVPGKSTISDYGNMIPVELTKALDAQLQKFVQRQPRRSFGAAMRNAGSAPTLTNCTFIGNTAWAGVVISRLRRFAKRRLWPT